MLAIIILFGAMCMMVVFWAMSLTLFADRKWNPYAVVLTALLVIITLMFFCLGVILK